MSVEKIKVFISYAWGEEEYNSSVRKLAEWLTANGSNKLEVISDHLHSMRPPTKGWPIWMTEQIEFANVVLILCCEKYHNRFLKREVTPQSGRGVTFEGAIITQEMYNNRLENSKYFPILADGGDMAHIPSILQPFSNGHKFPQDNEKILRLIFNDNDTFGNNSENDHASEILENEILIQITSSTNNGSQMKTSIQIIIRSFLTLNEISKIKISKTLGIFEDNFATMLPDDRDKEFFKVIKERCMLSELWKEINKIKPFENTLNPFI